jgi:hypothetical protein
MIVLVMITVITPMMSLILFLRTLNTSTLIIYCFLHIVPTSLYEISLNPQGKKVRYFTDAKPRHPEVK